MINLVRMEDIALWVFVLANLGIEANFVSKKFVLMIAQVKVNALLILVFVT